MFTSGVDEANEMLKERATSFGADAVIAMQYNYLLNPPGTFLFATGTAVKFE